jgi:hypothetical protein
LIAARHSRVEQGRGRWQAFRSYFVSSGWCVGWKTNASCPSRPVVATCDTARGSAASARDESCAGWGQLRRNFYLPEMSCISQFLRSDQTLAREVRDEDACLRRDRRAAYIGGEEFPRDPACEHRPACLQR